MFPAMNDRLETLPPAARWRPSAASGIAIVAGMMLTTAMPPLRGTALLAPLAVPAAMLVGVDV